MKKKGDEDQILWDFDSIINDFEQQNLNQQSAFLAPRRLSNLKIHLISPPVMPVERYLPGRIRMMPAISTHFQLTEIWNIPCNFK